MQSSYKPQLKPNYRISVTKLDKDTLVLHDNKSSDSKPFQIKIQHFYLIIFTRSKKCYSKFINGETAIEKFLTKPRYLHLKHIIGICPKKYSLMQYFHLLSNNKYKKIQNLKSSILDTNKKDLNKFNSENYSKSHNNKYVKSKSNNSSNGPINKNLNMLTNWNHVQCLKNFLKYYGIPIEEIKYYYWKLELMNELTFTSTLYNMGKLYEILKSTINNETKFNVEGIYKKIVSNYSYREIQILLYNPDRSEFINLIKNENSILINRILKKIIWCFIFAIVTFLIINSIFNN